MAAHNDGEVNVPVELLAASKFSLVLGKENCLAPSFFVRKDGKELFNTKVPRSAGSLTVMSYVVAGKTHWLLDQNGEITNNNFLHGAAMMTLDETNRSQGMTALIVATSRFGVKKTAELVALIVSGCSETDLVGVLDEDK